jgi:hypothetical protein
MSLTQNIPDLTELAKEHEELVNKIKKLEDRKKELREQIFLLADNSYEGKEYLLPTTSISVASDFLDKFFNGNVGEFVRSRFPAWNLLTTSVGSEGLILVLRKRPEFMPFSFEDEEVKLSRSPAESTPSIDWDIMKEYDAPLFGRVAKSVLTYELNEDELQKVISEDAGTIERLKYYLKAKQPTLRVLASRK